MKLEDEQLIGKDSEISGRNLFQHSSGETEINNGKLHSRAADNSDENRTLYLHNRSVESYRYTSLLCAL
jgi:hypothetical protein